MAGRKTELLEFIKGVSDDALIGIYYLDLNLNIPHFSVYRKSDCSVLFSKLEKLNDNLENDLLRVISWKQGATKEYLTGIYDGLNMQGENNDCVLYGK